MNRITAISAIVMFALVMGFAAFTPTALAKGPQPHEKTMLCHFDDDPDGDPTTADAAWEVIYPNNHAVQKHLDKHGDILIGDATDLAGDPPTITVDDCNNQIAPVP